MSYGLYGNQATSVPMVSAASITVPIDVRGANAVWVELPTFSVGMTLTSGNMYVRGSPTAVTSTFRRLAMMGNYSGATGVYNWELPYSTGNVMVQLPVAYFWNYIQLEFNMNATAAGYTPVVHKHQ